MAGTNPYRQQGAGSHRKPAGGSYGDYSRYGASRSNGRYGGRQASHAGQTARRGSVPSASVSANPYSRDAYAPRPHHAAPQGPHAAIHDSALLARRRRQRRRRKVLAIVAVVLAVLIVGTGTAFGIYSMQLDSKLALDDDQSIDEALAPAELTQPFYMLVIGSDSREGSGTSSNPAESGDNQRSDVMILTRVDVSNRQITLVSIPRDTPYYLEDGSVVKINEAYNYGGAAETIKAVSQLTGVPISHYAEIHFSELETLVDALGGVTVDVPIELSYVDALSGETVTLEPGEQTINGQQAQIFARARHEYGDNQEAKRQSAVRQLAEAIMKKAIDRPVYELPGTVLALADCVGTDLRTGDIITLATAFAGGSGDMTVYSGAGPSRGDYNDAVGGLWLCYVNEQGWADLMSVVDAGENPEGMDFESTNTGSAVPRN